MSLVPRKRIVIFTLSGALAAASVGVFRASQQVQAQEPVVSLSDATASTVRVASKFNNPKAEHLRTQSAQLILGAAEFRDPLTGEVILHGKHAVSAWVLSLVGDPLPGFSTVRVVAVVNAATGAVISESCVSQAVRRSDFSTPPVTETARSILWSGTLRSS